MFRWTDDAMTPPDDAEVGDEADSDSETQSDDVGDASTAVDEAPAVVEAPAATAEEASWIPQPEWNREQQRAHQQELEVGSEQGMDYQGSNRAHALVHLQRARDMVGSMPLAYEHADFAYAIPAPTQNQNNVEAAQVAHDGQYAPFAENLPVDRIRAWRDEVPPEPDSEVFPDLRGAAREWEDDDAYDHDGMIFASHGENIQIQWPYHAPINDHAYHGGDGGEEQALFVAHAPLGIDVDDHPLAWPNVDHNYHVGVLEWVRFNNVDYQAVPTWLPFPGFAAGRADVGHGSTREDERGHENQIFQYDWSEF